MNEGWDWTRTQHERCPQCHFDASAIEPERLAAAVTDSAIRECSGPR